VFDFALPIFMIVFSTRGMAHLKDKTYTNIRFLLFVTPLNAKLNPICHLLALLRVHYILHVSRMRVNYNQQDANIFDCLFLKGSTCFGRFLRPSSGAHNCTSATVISTNTAAGCYRGWEGTIPACSIIGWQYPKLNVQLCAPDDGRRNRPKHVEPFRNK